MTFGYELVDGYRCCTCGHTEFPTTEELDEGCPVCGAAGGLRTQHIARTLANTLVQRAAARFRRKMEAQHGAA